MAQQFFRLPALYPYRKLSAVRDRTGAARLLLRSSERSIPKRGSYARDRMIETDTRRDIPPRKSDPALPTNVRESWSSPRKLGFTGRSRFSIVKTL